MRRVWTRMSLNTFLQTIGEDWSCALVVRSSCRGSTRCVAVMRFKAVRRVNRDASRRGEGLQTGRGRRSSSHWRRSVNRTEGLQSSSHWRRLANRTKGLQTGRGRGSSSHWRQQVNRTEGLQSNSHWRRLANHTECQAMPGKGARHLQQAMPGKGARHLQQAMPGKSARHLQLKHRSLRIDAQRKHACLAHAICCIVLLPRTFFLAIVYRVVVLYSVVLLQLVPSAMTSISNNAA